MRNIEITPNAVVPKNLRIQIYKETYDKLKSGELSNDSEYPYGLCRFLPQILWNISLSDKAPNGDDWRIDTAQKIFPELGKEIKKLGRSGYLSPNERLEFLEKQIKHGRKRL